MNKFLLLLIFYLKFARREFYSNCQHSVLLRLGIPTKNNAIIIYIANKIILKKKTNDKKIIKYLQKLVTVKRKEIYLKELPKDKQIIHF